MHYHGVFKLASLRCLSTCVIDVPYHVHYQGALPRTISRFTDTFIIKAPCNIHCTVHYHIALACALLCKKQKVCRSKSLGLLPACQYNVSDLETARHLAFSEVQILPRLAQVCPCTVCLHQNKVCIAYLVSQIATCLPQRIFCPSTNSRFILYRNLFLYKYFVLRKALKPHYSKFEVPLYFISHFLVLQVVCTKKCIFNPLTWRRATHFSVDTNTTHWTHSKIVQFITAIFLNYIFTASSRYKLSFTQFYGTNFLLL